MTTPVTITVPEVADPELKVIGMCIQLIEPLSDLERSRVLDYLRRRFDPQAHSR